MAKRQQTKAPLSSLQRKRLLRLSLGIVAVALLWVFFAPESGVYHIRQQKKQLALLNAQREELVLKNRAMEQEIERLQHDKAFLERVAREKHGMLQDNELVFDFSKEDQKKKKKK
jgi:cell division protein FtsB